MTNKDDANVVCEIAWTYMRFSIYRNVVLKNSVYFLNVKVLVPKGEMNIYGRWNIWNKTITEDKKKNEIWMLGLFSKIFCGNENGELAIVV